MIINIIIPLLCKAWNLQFVGHDSHVRLTAENNSELNTYIFNLSAFRAMGTGPYCIIIYTVFRFPVLRSRFYNYGLYLIFLTLSFLLGHCSEN